MADLVSLAEQHRHLSEEAQKKAGQAQAGSMPDEHKQFLKLITAHLKSGSLEYHQTETFLNTEVYAKLSDTQKAQVDLATVNIADQLRHVAEFYLSRKTPDEGPQLQIMIEHLWQMKDRVEKKYGDVYKF